MYIFSPSLRRSLCAASLLVAAVGLSATLHAQTLAVDTTFQAPLFSADAKPSRILVLPDDRFMVFSGYEDPFVGFDRLNGQPTGDLLRFNADGSLDTTFQLDPALRAESPTNVVATTSGQYIISTYIIAGSTTNSKVYRLNADGSLDSSFDPGTGVGPSGLIRALAVQADGKPLVGGSDVASYNGINTGDFFRMNIDGSVDSSFNVTLANGSLSSVDGINTEGAIQVQPDGKIIIVGGFTRVNGTTALSVVRLNPDGSVDTSFAPSGFNLKTNPASSTLHGIRSAILQPDGKVILTGEFNGVSATSYQQMVRLNSDGSVDPSFSGPSGLGSGFYIKLAPDGKILLTTTGGGDGRFNSDGSPDTAFDNNLPDLPDLSAGSPTGGFIGDFGVQSSGQVLIVGGFYQANTSPRPGLARLNVNGTLDASFDPGQITADAAPYHIAVLADGTILASGSFDTVGGVPQPGLALLNADGSPSGATFPVPFFAGNSYGPDFLAQPDGKIFVYGSTPSDENGNVGFTFLRLNADLSVDTGFTADPSVTQFGSVYYQDGGGYLLSPGSFDPVAYISTTGGFATNAGFFLQRLGLQGTLDTTFQPGIDVSTIFSGAGPGNGDDSTIAVGIDSVLAVQPDGKILYKYFDLTSNYRLVRLNPDGSADASFQTGSAVPGVAPYSGYTGTLDVGAGSEQAQEISAGSTGISGLTVQPDGRLLLYGDLTQYNGTAVSGLLRLNADGSVDGSFGVGSGPQGATGASVSSLVAQPDGKLLVAGSFQSFNGAAAPGIARLNADGSVDGSFGVAGLAYQQTSIGPSGTGQGSSQLVAEPDGSYLLTGNYTTAGGLGSGTILHLTTGSGLPSFFDGTVALSGGFYYLAFPGGNVFGYFSLDYYPYLYHNDLGFEYVFDAQDGNKGVYLYDFASSTFFYTSPSFPFPYLYDFTLNSVLYYYPDPNNPGFYTKNPRYFYNFSTGETFTK